MFVPKLPRIQLVDSVLQRSLFDLRVKIVMARLPAKKVQDFLYTLPQQSVLTIPKLKPIIADGEDKAFRRILLARQQAPLVIQELGEELLNNYEATLLDEEITLKYENWNSEQILEAVLPEGWDAPSSYEQAGHLIRLNLPEEMDDNVASLIGQVLLDKLPGVRTVVRKTANISNQFRVLPLKVVAGVEDMVVTVRESDCTFRFDYSSVYWNSRLQQEHGRLVEMIFKRGDVIVDMFCGVGPFAIPAAKRGCVVHANDLNPDSFKWLQENIKLNKLRDTQVRAYNQDAHEFIVGNHFEGVKHVIMNLPASSTTFLDVFPREGFEEASFHCYLFTKGPQDPLQLVQDGLRPGVQLWEAKAFNVRNVAPNKEMFRVSFKLKFQDKDVVDNEYVVDNELFSGDNDANGRKVKRAKILQ